MRIGCSYNTQGLFISMVMQWLPAAGVLCDAGADGCWVRDCGGVAEGCVANGDAVLTEDTV